MEAAFQAIREAVRYGIWLLPRSTDKPGTWGRSGLVNMHRIATLRFLAFCGWKEAEPLLAALPLGDPEFEIHQYARRRHAHEGQPTYWPGHLEEGTPEHTEAVRKHRAYFRRVIPPRAFKEIGESVAQEIGADVLAPAVRAALLLTVPLFLQRGSVNPATLPTDTNEWSLLQLRIDRPVGWSELAFTASIDGWRDYLSSFRYHRSDRPATLARALRDATAAAEYMCAAERDAPEPVRTGQWNEHRGGGIVRSCARAANAAVKRAMLPAAAIAAAGTLA